MRADFVPITAAGQLRICTGIPFHDGIRLRRSRTDSLGKDSRNRSRTADSKPDDDIGRLLSLLTPRETEVLLLRLEGLKYHEIAGELDISLNTVGTLLVRSMRKLREAVRPAYPSAPQRERTDTKPRRSREPLQ